VLSIAVIGGGTAAATMVESVAHELVAESIQVDVTVFDPSPHLWCGQVFQPDGPEVLSNLRMPHMSLRPWDPDHGVRWLRANGHGTDFCDRTTTHFLPRELVGRYLRDTVAGTMSSIAEAGSRITIVPDRVCALRRIEARWWAFLHAHRRGPFDVAILCVGNSPSYDPYLLAGHQAHIATPYPLWRSLHRVPDSAHVGIVGAGLSAVDVVMGLRARGHQGPITLMSRRGLLPAVRRRPIEFTPRHCTVDNLEAAAAPNETLAVTDFVNLVTAELHEWGCDPSVFRREITSTVPVIERLREDISQADDGNPDIGWQVMQGLVATAGQDIWYMLSDRDKKQLRHTYHQFIMRLCCPMPVSNAMRLLAMFDTGQLKVMSGLQSITPAARNKQCAKAGEHEAILDFTIDASTPSVHEVSPTARSLVDSLTAQGWATPHPFGGLRLDRRSSRLIDAHGVPDPTIYALGDLAHGAYLFTHGIPVITPRAVNIARSIRSWWHQPRWLPSQLSRAVTQKALAAELLRTKDDASKWTESTEPETPNGTNKRPMAAKVSLRLQSEELAQMHSRAESAGQTMSAYLRSVAMRDIAGPNPGVVEGRLDLHHRDARRAGDPTSDPR